MIHQGLFFNCFSSGREEPLGWEPTALHHSRNSVGHTELHPKMGGAAPRHSPGARWGVGTRVYKQEKLLKKCH